MLLFICSLPSPHLLHVVVVCLKFNRRSIPSCVIHRKYGIHVRGSSLILSMLQTVLPTIMVTRISFTSYGICSLQWRACYRLIYSILRCVLFIICFSHILQEIYFLRGPKSYRKISPSLEAARLVLTFPYSSADTRVKFQSDVVAITDNIVASKHREILR